MLLVKPHQNMRQVNDHWHLSASERIFDVMVFSCLKLHDDTVQQSYRFPAGSYIVGMNLRNLHDFRSEIYLAENVEGYLGRFVISAVAHVCRLGNRFVGILSLQADSASSR